MNGTGFTRRFAALLRKETRQMLRDQEMPEYEKTEHVFYVM